MPGFIDAHGHVIELGEHALQLDLVGTSSLADLQQRLRDYAAAHPDANGFSAPAGTRSCGRTRSFQRPLISMPSSAIDLSCSGASTDTLSSRIAPAMKAAGVTAYFNAAGRLDRENGAIVDNAKDLINKVVPDALPAEPDEAFVRRRTSYWLRRYGVGSMSTALGDWEAMKRAGKGGRLTSASWSTPTELNLRRKAP